MDYSNITLFKMMQTKMAYHSERQDVLSENIANLDTPGYKANDLRELDFKRLVRSFTNKLKMHTTSELHNGGIRKMTDTFREEKDRDTYEIKPVKNTVVLEEQMAMVADNKMQHQLTTNLYKKTSNLFKVAIGVGQ